MPGSTLGHRPPRSATSTVTLLLALAAAVLLALPLPMVAMGLLFSPMMFDAPGSASSAAPWIMIGSLLAYPVAWLASAAAAWFLRRRGHHWASVAVFVLPVLAASPVGGLFVVEEMQSRAQPSTIRDVAFGAGDQVVVTASSDNERNGWLLRVRLDGAGRPAEEGAAPLAHEGGVNQSWTGPRRWQVAGVDGGSAWVADPRMTWDVRDLASGLSLAKPVSAVGQAASVGTRVLVAVPFEGLSLHEGGRAPRQVGSLGLPEAVYRLAALDATHAVVAIGDPAGMRELRVFDLSDPSALRARGTWSAGGAPATNVVAGGSLVAVVDDRGRVRLVDFTDRDAPVARGTLSVPGRPGRLAAQPGLVAIGAMDDSAVTLVDVTDAASPRSLGHVRAAGRNPALALRGGRLLVGAERTLRSFDLADPAAPILAGELALKVR